MPSSTGFSQLRDRTHVSYVSCIGRFLTTSATWEAPEWSKDLNVRLDTIKLLEKNTGRTLLDISHSNVLLDPSPSVMVIKTNKWDLIGHKRFA